MVMINIVCSRTPRYYAPLARGPGQQQQQHPPPPPISRTMSSYGSGRGGPPHPHQQRSRSFAADSLRHNLERSLYLDFERGDAGSPSSDNILFDHMCYATTPSSSNGNSDMEMPPMPPLGGGGSSSGPGSVSGGSRSNQQQQATSPTSRLLLEYEMHLRNTLAKGMDAESCSLHTFEALLSQSMEDLGKNHRLGSTPFFLFVFHFTPFLLFISFSFFIPLRREREAPNKKEKKTNLCVCRQYYT